LADVDLDAATGEAVALGGVEDRLRRHAVAADTHRLADLGELRLAAMERHDHAQRRGAAVRPLELLDERDALAGTDEAELLQRGKARANVVVVLGLFLRCGGHGGESFGRAVQVFSGDAVGAASSGRERLVTRGSTSRGRAAGSRGTARFAP